MPSLPRRNTPEEMSAAAERNRRHKREGGRNVQNAARAVGARRYIVQSCGFWYAPGDGLAVQNDSLAFDGSAKSIAAGTRTYAEIEQRVFEQQDMEGVGATHMASSTVQGLAYHRDGAAADRARAQQLPLIGKGQGVWSFVHVEDAAAATAAALHCAPGVYNVVDDHPSPMSVWLPAFARAVDAPPPPALDTADEDAAYYATRLRGASNAKAKRELNFAPRPLEWLRVLAFLLVLAAASMCQGQIAVQAVLNGASYSGNLAPGTWVAIFGTQLASSDASAASVPLSPLLNGVSVTFGGIAAPLLYVSPNQINALIPFEVPLPPVTGTVPVVVSAPTGTSPAFNVRLSQDSPGLFTQNSAGTGAALAFNPSFQPVTALGDSAMILYASGLGQTNPPASSASGGAPSEPFNRVVDNLSVFVGETEATVSFAGLAPGFPGIYQLNVIPNGPVTDRVYLKVNGWESNNVTVPLPPGANATNIMGTIGNLYPPSVAPINSSVTLMAGTFTASFDIAPGAKPFAVAATSEGGTAIINIDPAAGTWQASISTPTAAGLAWNFSRSEFGSVFDLLTCTANGGCLPFPGNVIPVSRLDPLALEAEAVLQIATTTTAGSVNGTFTESGTLPSNGHFSIDQSTLKELTNFGGFIQIPEAGPGTRTTTFSLFIDGQLIASKDVNYSVAQP